MIGLNKFSFGGTDNTIGTFFKTFFLESMLEKINLVTNTIKAKKMKDG